MAEVIAIASQERVDRAWVEYAAKASELQHDHRLLCDRAFNEELARLHERWKRLFLASDRQA